MTGPNDGNGTGPQDPEDPQDTGPDNTDGADRTDSTDGAGADGSISHDQIVDGGDDAQLSQLSQVATAGDRTEPIEIQQEMQRSFIDYAMSVIVARALPDVRDGLKPVHRRVLYSMYESGFRPDTGG